MIAFRAITLFCVFGSIVYGLDPNIKCPGSRYINMLVASGGLFLLSLIIQ